MSEWQALIPKCFAPECLMFASTPEELSAHLKSEAQKYSKVIKAANIKLD